MKTTFQSRKLLLGAAALAASIFGGSLAATGAHASYTICRTDPIVQLSNGYQLKVVDSVTDTSADISSISYSVHVPMGTGVSKITYTGGAFAGKETLTVYADQPTKTYSVSTLATTLTSGIKVSMSVTLANSTKTLVSTSASGTSGTAISVSFKH